MKKQTLIILGIIIIIIAILGGIMLKVSDNKKERDDNSYENQNNNTYTSTTNNKKTAVLYFSATGTTKKVAQMIAEINNSDIIEIIPKEIYTEEDLTYQKDCRANREQNDINARPEIKNSFALDSYDTIYLGYPIWWGKEPKIILTLLDQYHLEGKTIIPFCTSGGSSINTSVKNIRDYNKKLNILEGKNFNASTTKEEIRSWISSLN